MSSDDERLSFGPYLQAARLSRQISLERIARETRINLKILTAIDNEALADLPQPVFLKGFLRAYAAAVGADGREAVERYERFLLRQRTLGMLPGEPGRPAGTLGRRLGITIGLLALLILLCLMVYRQTGITREEPPVPPAAAADSGPGPSLEPQPLEADRPQASAAPATARPAAPGKHVLTVAAREAGWIKVIIDQGSPAEHPLKPGDLLKLEARNGFNLLIGNAAGVTLALDGKPVQVPGKRGEIVNLHLP